MEFTLGKSKKVYKLPLAASMPMGTLKRMTAIASIEGEEQQGAAALELEFDILREYIGEAADKLTGKEVNEIFTAWREESDKQGASAGE